MHGLSIAATLVQLLKDRYHTEEIQKCKRNKKASYGTLLSV
jgi:hypothetical protein